MSGIVDSGWRNGGLDQLRQPLQRFDAHDGPFLNRRRRRPRLQHPRRNLDPHAVHEDSDYTFAAPMAVDFQLPAAQRMEGVVNYNARWKRARGLVGVA